MLGGLIMGYIPELELYSLYSKDKSYIHYFKVKDGDLTHVRFKDQTNPPLSSSSSSSAQSPKKTTPKQSAKTSSDDQYTYTYSYDSEYVPTPKPTPKKATPKQCR